MQWQRYSDILSDILQDPTPQRQRKLRYDSATIPKKQEVNQSFASTAGFGSRFWGGRG